MRQRRRWCKRFSFAVPTAKDEDQTYMAIIIGVLMAVIILLAVAIFLIVSRHRRRKCFASPLVGKSALAAGNGGCPGMSSGSSCGTGGSYKDAGTASSVSHHGNGGHRPAGPVNGGHLHDMDRLIQLDAEPYQEPYRPHHTPFYGYSTVVVGRNLDSGSEYRVHPASGRRPAKRSSTLPSSQCSNWGRDAKRRSSSTTF